MVPVIQPEDIQGLWDQRNAFAIGVRDCRLVGIIAADVVEGRPYISIQLTRITAGAAGYVSWIIPNSPSSIIVEEVCTEAVSASGLPTVKAGSGLAGHVGNLDRSAAGRQAVLRKLSSDVAKANISPESPVDHYAVGEQAALNIHRQAPSSVSAQLVFW